MMIPPAIAFTKAVPVTKEKTPHRPVAMTGARARSVATQACHATAIAVDDDRQ